MTEYLTRIKPSGNFQEAASESLPREPVAGFEHEAHIVVLLGIGPEI